MLSIPFAFHVPTAAPQGRFGGPGQTSCYPPSLEVGKRYLSSPSSNIRSHGFVRYHVEARLYEGDRMIMARTADIRVLNTITELPPPIPLDDFPEEYACAVSKLLGSGKIKTWWSNRCNAHNSPMRLSITIPEPTVLRLGYDHSQQNNDPTTNAIELIAALNLKTFSLAADEIPAPPEDLHVTMSWLLKTTTFVSVVPMENTPTLAETASDPYIARSSTCTPLRTAKMVLRDWIPTSITSSDGISQPSPIDHASASAFQSAPLPLPRCSSSFSGRPKKSNISYEADWHKKERLHLPLPGIPECPTTFSTPYISRRHCLHLQLECRSPGCASVLFRFRVPVQIASTRTARVNHYDAATIPPPSSSENVEILSGGGPVREMVASPVYSR